MGYSVNVNPTGVPENTPSPTVESAEGAQTTTSTTSTTPFVEQPVQDDISPFVSTFLGATIVYAASQQVPVLQKPEPENKSEKKEKTEKKEGAATADQQTVDADGGVDSEHKSENQEDGQQGGGQGGSGSQNSDSGTGSSSQGFSDGRGKGQSEGVNTETTVGSATASTSVNASAKGDAADTIENGQTIFVDPLKAPTTITASGLFSPPVNPAQFFSNGDKLMTELYTANVKFAESMAEGPDKMRFVDFLKAVQGALIDFQELLRTLQMQDSKGARERSEAKLETTLAKIDEQRKQQEEIFKKQHDAAQKMKVMGPLMVIFAFLMVVMLSVMLLVMGMMLIASGPFGWMALGMMVCEMVDQAAKVIGQQPFMMKKLIEVISSMTNSIVASAADTFHLTPEEEKKAKLVAKTVAVSIAMAMAVYAAPAAFVFSGGAPLTSFLTESHIIRDMQMQSGMDETAASKVEMYATIAITAAMAIAGLAVAIMMPVGALGGVLLAVGNTIAKYSLKAAEAAVAMLRWVIELGQFFKVGERTAEKAVRTMQAMLEVMLDPNVWASVTGLGLQTTSGVMTYQYENILADIAIIQGQMDSEVELKETTIMILKKMIKQLLDGLQGFADEIGQISQLLKKTHSDVSQISSNLFA